jgi:hypothetical protein
MAVDNVAQFTEGISLLHDLLEEASVALATHTHTHTHTHTYTHTHTHTHTPSSDHIISEYR